MGLASLLILFKFKISHHTVNSWFSPGQRISKNNCSFWVNFFSKSDLFVKMSRFFPNEVLILSKQLLELPIFNSFWVKFDSVRMMIIFFLLNESIFCYFEQIFSHLVGRFSLFGHSLKCGVIMFSQNEHLFAFLVICPLVTIRNFLCGNPHLLLWQNSLIKGEPKVSNTKYKKNTYYYTNSYLKWRILIHCIKFDVFRRWLLQITCTNPMIMPDMCTLSGVIRFGWLRVLCSFIRDIKVTFFSVSGLCHKFLCLFVHKLEQD